MQSDRQPADESARNAHRRQPGQIDRRGVNVLPIHSRRVVSHLSQLKSGAGCGWTGDEVAFVFVESAREIVGDEMADFGRSPIVFVAVAVRKRVSAQQNPPLDFAPESGGARFFIHLFQGLALDAQAVANAVVARQIARRFGGAQNIIRRHPQIERGHIEGDDFCAKRFENPDRVSRFLRGFVVQPVGEKLIGNADFAPDQRILEARREIFTRRIDRGRIAAIEVAQGGKPQRAIGGVAGDDSGLVETRGERNHSPTRDAPISRLDGGDAAKRRRLAHRSSRVGADGERAKPRRHRRRRAARTAAGRARQIPRIFCRPESRILARRPHREFVHIGFADDGHRRRAQVFDHRRVVSRAEVFEHLRGASCRLSFDAKNIFERDRNKKLFAASPFARHWASISSSSAKRKNAFKSARAAARAKNARATSAGRKSPRAAPRAMSQADNAVSSFASIQSMIFGVKK